MADDVEFEYDDSNIKICLCKVGEQYVARMNRDAAVELLSGLHFLQQGQAFGEDISFFSSDCKGYGCKGAAIHYCEIRMSPTHLHKKQGKNILKEPKMIRHTPHGILDADGDFLIFHVSIEEARVAYETMKAMLDAEESWRPRETILFDTLTIRVMSE